MGQIKNEWHDTATILQLFGNHVSTARGKYAEFVEEGVAQGRKHELTGGGLIRSVGGWQELGGLRRC